MRAGAVSVFMERNPATGLDAGQADSEAGPRSGGQGLEGLEAGAVDTHLHVSAARRSLASPKVTAARITPSP